MKLQIIANKSENIWNGKPSNFPLSNSPPRNQKTWKANLPLLQSLAVSHETNRSFIHLFIYLGGRRKLHYRFDDKTEMVSYDPFTQPWQSNPQMEEYDIKSHELLGSSTHKTKLTKAYSIS